MTNEVLMFAFMNAEALAHTIRTKKATYWSRSRNKIWVKGEESGNTQKLIRVEVDCDRDTILFLVEPKGPACHRNTESCFGDRPFSLERLEQIIAEREKGGDETSYTRKLLAKPALLKEKLQEEAEELAIAPDRDNARWEAADLLYHTLVAMRSKGVSLADAIAELGSRH